MQYVGVACSVGMAVQLPLILRSLADSLAFVPASDLPIKIDKDFLSWMGSIPYAHIPEHAMNWWASKAARKLPGHYLQESTLELCLETYRRTHADVRLQITLTPPPQPLPAARCVMCRELRVLYIQATESLIGLRNTCAANRDNLIAYGEMGAATDGSGLRISGTRADERNSGAKYQHVHRSSGLIRFRGHVRFNRAGCSGATAA